jgi:hypothetical protein
MINQLLYLLFLYSNKLIFGDNEILESSFKINVNDS